MQCIATYPLLTKEPESASDSELDDADVQDWNWDRRTLVEAENLQCSLTNGGNIVSLVVMQNGLQPVKGLRVKHQKQNSDVCDVYDHIDFVINGVQCLTDLEGMVHKGIVHRGGCGAHHPYTQDRICPKESGKSSSRQLKLGPSYMMLTYCVIDIHWAHSVSMRGSTWWDESLQHVVNFAVPTTKEQ